MATPFKLKYKNSEFPFKSPLHHDKDADGNVLEEHAHGEHTLRGIKQDFITVSGKRGKTLGHDNPHSSTKGTYSELLKKKEDAELKKLLKK